MNLEIGSKYKLNFEVGGRILTYTGKIISCEDGFVVFLDKFNKEITYNLNSLINVEVLSQND